MIRRVLSPPRLLSGLRRRLLSALPAKPDDSLAVFASWNGRHATGNPAAIGRELSRRRPEIRQIWVVDSGQQEPDWPVTVVRPGSSQHVRALQRAKYVISNDTLPRYWFKRGDKRYLQTWHGTPLKRLGFDVPRPPIPNENYEKTVAKDVARWDALLSQSPYCTGALKGAFRYSGSVLELGYPRNDVLVAEDPVARTATRQRLDIAPHQRVILWAPTFRDTSYDPRSGHVLDLRADLQKLSELLDDKDLLMLRTHHLVHESGASRGIDGVRDVSSHPDVQDLLLAADVLVTDYSSTMFDFAVTRRPILLYAWDLDQYRDRTRGFYLDYASTVPGPVTRSAEELAATLADLASVASAFGERYDAFVSRFCPWDDGHASKRVVEEWFEN
jgi:CDP-glycerol glycerophosphotransferase